MLADFDCHNSNVYIILFNNVKMPLHKKKSPYDLENKIMHLQQQKVAPVLPDLQNFTVNRLNPLIRSSSERFKK